MRFVRVVCVASLVGLPSAASAATGVIIGDSIGMGVTAASGLKSLARLSIHIRGNKAIAQINEAPAGATAFVVLGTNDAQGSLKGIEQSVDNIVQAAERKNLSLVWIGPPCVRRSWNTGARKLDEMLQARFANTSIKYVSMQDETLCSGKFHAPDGVHLTMAGYHYMWEKAARAADFPITTVARATAPAKPMKLASADDGAVPAKPKKPKRTKPEITAASADVTGTAEPKPKKKRKAKREPATTDVSSLDLPPADVPKPKKKKKQASKPAESTAAATDDASANPAKPKKKKKQARKPAEFTTASPGTNVAAMQKPKKPASKPAEAVEPAAAPANPD